MMASSAGLDRGHRTFRETLSNEDEDQSSLDLSLCLRGGAGSTDSRNSFYMDLDKGIDSDIDGAVDCTSEDEGGDYEREGEVKGSQSLGPASNTQCRTGRACDIWVGLRPQGNRSDEEMSVPHSSVYITNEEQINSSLSSKTNFNGKYSNGINGQMLADAPLLNEDHESLRFENGQNILTDSKNKSKYLFIKPPRSLSLDDDVFSKRKENSFLQRMKNGDSLVVVLSAMYAKLLVVMGISFPLSEVISPYIPPSFFVGFYLYLYSGSILFLVYAYSFLLHKSDSNGNRVGKSFLRKMSIVAGFEKGRGNNFDDSSKVSSVKKRRFHEAPVHCGSFYLRMGALAFGIGSMIYCGLEFGQFFEVKPNSECYSILMAVTPCTQMAFTFIQLYFIFMNSKMCIDKFKNIARFGLMHMVATNLCVWLYVLVQESKHEILKFTDPSHGHGSGSGHAKRVGAAHDLLTATATTLAPLLNTTHANIINIQSNPIVHELNRRVARGLRHAATGFQCRRMNIMGQLVQDVSPFLFPCAIEYSLICAAILYVMWKNIGKHEQHTRHSSSVSSDVSTPANSRRHHYSVDCAHANKGLFTGILVLVLAIISLILFFVLINTPEYKDLAVLEAHISELVLYCLNTIAAIVALMQVREMRYSEHRYVELDNILLIVAQTGVYLFSIFCIIGGHFTISRNTVLVLLTALANLIQATVQTIFVLDASRRYATTTDQVRRKPGREMITFLLVCNFAMWAISSLETRRSDSNPVQLNFYGFWAWTIIAHISTPLAIFFRFHSTVCLCEIWKKLYKLKTEPV